MKVFVYIFFLVLLSSFGSGEKHGKGIQAMEKISVVTNLKNKTEQLTKKQLYRVFSGEVVRWSDKSKVVLAIMKSNTSAGKIFAEYIMEMSPTEVDQYYLSLVFQGKISAPKTFNSVEELKSFVAATPGAIGVLPKENVDETVKPLKIGETGI